MALEAVAPQDEEEFRRVAGLLGLGQQPSTELPDRRPGTVEHAVVRLGPVGAAVRSGSTSTPTAQARDQEDRDEKDENREAYEKRERGGEGGKRVPVAEANPGGSSSPASVDGGGEGDGAPGSGTGIVMLPDAADAADAADAVPAPGGAPGHRPRSTLHPVGDTPPWEQNWARDGLPRPDRALMALQPPYTPLLARSSTLALLEAALSGSAPDGDVDIEDAVELLARGLPLAFLPRRMRRTLRHGVQILVDHGPALEPFTRDQAQLRERVEALVGKGKTELLHFAHSPLRGAGAGPLWTWDAYRPPPRDSAVLVLSDCGTIGPPGDRARSTPAEWQRFAELVRHGGARPLALLPVPERRVPQWLAAIMPVLCWDRGTTVGRVAAQMNAWRERCRPHLLVTTDPGGRV
ncbi:hypothetical protein ACF08O_08115 [Streptomyces paradoxus]|uniref:hypothetical protein n=1 Tax=Streptomyces paradoxus TaxID=66375 RepID=UPI003700D1EC